MIVGDSSIWEICFQGAVWKISAPQLFIQEACCVFQLHYITCDYIFTMNTSTMLFSLITTRELQSLLWSFKTSNNGCKNKAGRNLRAETYRKIWTLHSTNKCATRPVIPGYCIKSQQSKMKTKTCLVTTLKMMLTLNLHGWTSDKPRMREQDKRHHARLDGR